MLAIADFVPGDVDKEPDDRGLCQRPDRRRFQGLPRDLDRLCARCHDHKFDPISTEDYYALAGIFFSTRLIPGPVAGNTPLVRVPLLSQSELKQLQDQQTADKHRRAELEQELPDAADRAYVSFLRHVISSNIRLYLVSACQITGSRRTGKGAASLAELARQNT